MGKYKIYDIQSDNLDKFFAFLIDKSTFEQRQKIPTTLKRKLIQKSGKVSPHKLLFVEKLFILCNALDTRFTVLLENDNIQDKISVMDFRKFYHQIVNGEILRQSAKDLLDKGIYAVGDKELMRWMFYLSDVSSSGIYKALIKLKNTKTTNKISPLDNLQYLINFLLIYESNKGKIIRDFSIKMIDFYILLYFYDGNKKPQKNVYETFRFANNVSKFGVSQSINRLASKKMLEKHGLRGDRAIMASITSLGIKTVNDIVTKYIII